jgi:hypothetical protein
MMKTARLSTDGRYRYTLGRRWDEALPRAVFVMLNPSTADDTVDDPTIRRCVGFARRWEYGAITVVNLFAYRATRPAELIGVLDPVGRDNDETIALAAEEAALVVAAWGAGGGYLGRDRQVMKILASVGALPMCIGAPTTTGFPRHPLYLRNDARISSYGGRP